MSVRDFRIVAQNWTITKWTKTHNQPINRKSGPGQEARYTNSCPPRRHSPGPASQQAASAAAEGAHVPLGPLHRVRLRRKPPQRRLKVLMSCDVHEPGIAVARSGPRAGTQTQKTIDSDESRLTVEKNYRIVDRQLTCVIPHQVLGSPPLCVRMATG